MTTGNDDVKKPSDEERAAAFEDAKEIVSDFGDAIEDLNQDYAHLGISFGGNWMVRVDMPDTLSDVASGWRGGSNEAVVDLAEHIAMLVTRDGTEGAEGAPPACPHCALISLLKAATFICERLDEGALAQPQASLDMAKELIGLIIKAGGGPEAFGDLIRVSKVEAGTKH